MKLCKSTAMESVGRPVVGRGLGKWGWAGVNKLSSEDFFRAVKLFCDTVMVNMILCICQNPQNFTAVRVNFNVCKLKKII